MGTGISEFISGQPGDAWGFVGMALIFALAEAIRLGTKPAPVVVPPDLAAFLEGFGAVSTVDSSRSANTLCDYD
jgi:hypothetical protein